MTTREMPLSSDQIARLFDKDVRTTRRWVKAGAPHRKKEGRTLFLLSELIPWRERQLAMEQSSSPDEARERARKLRAEAGMAELRHRQMLGELVPAKDVEQTWELVLGVVRSRIDALRAKWAPRFLGLKTHLEAVVVLDEMAADLRASIVAGADELDAEGDTDEESAA